MNDDLELPDTFPDFSTCEYWESRYSAENTSYD